MAIVHIPTTFRALCAGLARVELPAATLDELLRALDERCPGFYSRVVEAGRVRPELAVAIDGEAMSYPLHEPLRPNSDVTLVPAIGGGAEPTRVVRADRAGRDGRISAGCTAFVRDGAGRVLLTRRADNGQWCMPGGGVDPGESVEETCLRELEEETGLTGRVLRLTGVYSDPDRLVIYPDGNRVQVVALCFEVEVTGGELRLTDETTAFGYFHPEDWRTLDLLDGQALRMEDALRGHAGPMIR